MPAEPAPEASSRHGTRALQPLAQLALGRVQLGVEI
jgi:hypothetical protein